MTVMTLAGATSFRKWFSGSTAGRTQLLEAFQPKLNKLKVLWSGPPAMPSGCSGGAPAHTAATGGAGHIFRKGPLNRRPSYHGMSMFDPDDAPTAAGAGHSTSNSWGQETERHVQQSIGYRDLTAPDNDKSAISN